MDLPPLARDIRRVAHEVVPGPWVNEGWGNRLVEGGYDLFANPQGYPRPFEIIVGIVKRGGPSGRPVLWYRLLRNDGTWMDQQGHSHTLDTDPETWLSVVLLAARDEHLRLIHGGD